MVHRKSPMLFLVNVCWWTWWTSAIADVSEIDDVCKSITLNMWYQVIVAGIVARVVVGTSIKAWRPGAQWADIVTARRVLSISH